MMAKKKEQVKLIIVGEEQDLKQEPVAETKKAVKMPMSFDAWWLLTQQRLKLKPELKESVKKHLEARGFMKNENYNEGLIDFGIKT
jgi:hypothetical protein